MCEEGCWIDWQSVTAGIAELRGDLDIVKRARALPKRHLKPFTYGAQPRAWLKGNIGYMNWKL